MFPSGPALGCVEGVQLSSRDAPGNEGLQLAHRGTAVVSPVTCDYKNVIHLNGKSSVCAVSPKHSL